MRPKNAKFLICIMILLVSFAQISLAVEANSTPQNPLDQFIIATMRVLLAIGVIISIIAFTIIALVSPLPWWVLALTASFLLVVFYFITKYILHLLRKLRIPSRIGYKLSKRRIPVPGYGSQFVNKAAVVKRKIPDISYLTPGFIINWMLGDFENGKITWQMFAMGALVILGTSIGVIILLFGHLSF